MLVPQMRGARPTNRRATKLERATGADEFDRKGVATRYWSGRDFASRESRRAEQLIFTPPTLLNWRDLLPNLRAGVGFNPATLGYACGYGLQVAAPSADRLPAWKYLRPTGAKFGSAHLEVIFQ
jgi:hypothetical protein